MTKQDLIEAASSGYPDGAIAAWTTGEGDDTALLRDEKWKPEAGA